MADSPETTDQVRGALNFGRLPDPLLWDHTVPDAACRLYSALTRYGQQRNPIVPGRVELAARMHWSVDKLDKMTAALEATGLLYVERRKGADGRNLRSTYWIDGSRPPGVPPSRKSAATPSRKSAATPTSEDAQTPSSDPSRKSAAQERVELEQEHSATTVAGSGAAGAMNEETPQTFLARLIDYVRQTTGDATYSPDAPTKGKLLSCIVSQLKVGASTAQVNAGIRDWANAEPARDASQLRAFIDARRRKPKPTGSASAAYAHHDGHRGEVPSSGKRSGMSALDRAALYASTGDPRWAPRNGDHDPADPPTMPIEEQQARLAAIIAADEAATLPAGSSDGTVP